MNSAFVEILERARTLPDSEKEELARILVSEFDGHWDEDVKAAWVEECNRRWELYKDGELQAYDGDEVMARLRSRFE